MLTTSTFASSLPGYTTKVAVAAGSAEGATAAGVLFVVVVSVVGGRHPE